MGVVSVIKACDTCRCAVLFGTPMLNSTVCPGYRAHDERIWAVADCPQWRAAPRRWTITQAIAFTTYIGEPMSRPTVIKLCMATHVGRQLSGRGSPWRIQSDGFKQLVKNRLGEE